VVNTGVGTQKRLSSAQSHEKQKEPSRPHRFANIAFFEFADIRRPLMNKRL
jgi:hypothetical protein